MSSGEDTRIEVTADILLRAYACGIFPMAESSTDESMFWVEPDMRGIIPLENFHIPRSLKKTLRKTSFTISIDTDFKAVITECAKETTTRDNTWINDQIKELYCELHELNHAHSFEVWDNDQLVGGLYGVRLGRAFFGESMFSRKTDASKIALVHLVYQMKKQGFILLDTQFTTEHLEKFGAIEIPKHEYQLLLEDALTSDEAFFDCSLNQEGGATSDSILQLFSQIS